MSNVLRTFVMWNCVSALLALAPAPAPAATLPAAYSETVYASGIANPTAMEFAPDRRLFVCQQSGALRVIENGTLLDAPFITVGVDDNGERGLLGIAFDPGFAANRYVYVYYTARLPVVHNRVSRFTANGNLAVPGSEVVLLDLNNLSGADNHNGGAIHFGADSKLYIAAGENANPANAQTRANLLGKMLRINSDGSIPMDNPFYNTETGNNRAIWALGLRNPFTFAVQPGTGRIFVNDVGGGTREEINELVRGANYGWPACEGACNPVNPNFRDPIFSYRHGGGGTNGNSIAGGAFYNPATNQFPVTEVGAYFFADYVNGWIRKLDPNNGNQVAGFATGISNPVDLKVGADGRLYYLARGNGRVMAIFALANAAPSIVTQPTNRTVTAGQTATFVAVAAGTAPLSYQWLFNGAPLSGRTAATLSIANAGLADAGNYSVVITNVAGAVTSSVATLTVTLPLDLQAPVISITSPSAAFTQVTSNAVNVTGTAADAGGVSSVIVQAGGFSATNAFGSAPTSTNWTVTVSLTPGTNVIRAIATDLAGNSATNSKVVFFAVLSPPSIVTQPTNRTVTVSQTATFVVAATGTAPLSYQWLFNGVPLPGRTAATLSIANARLTNAGNYSVVITNVAGAVTSAVVTLTVNLPLDVKAPAISIASPSAAFTRVTSNAVNVAGTAADAGGVGNVIVQAGGFNATNTFGAATTATNWTATVPLTPGTNVIRAIATDLAGNSATNSKVVFFAVLSQITLDTNGTGSVRGATNHQPLEVGKNYTLTAMPGNGFVFSNWTGGLTSSAPVLNFFMRSNLALAAIFVPNPFDAWAGAYNGLFYETNGGVRHGASGFFNLVLRPDGSFSARLQQGVKKHSFTGRFNLEGNSTNLVKRSGTNNVTTELALNLHGAEQITGRITDASWEARLIADRATFNARTAPATNYADSYTLLIPGSTNSPAEPAGDGAGCFKVDAGGNVNFTGILADGSPVAQKVPLARNGTWPFYAPLYGGRGSALGWILITNSAQPDLGGLVSWSRPAGPSPKLHTNGFALDSMLIGSFHHAPGTNTIFGLSNAIITLSEGNLAKSFTNSVNLAASARVIDGGTNKLKLSLSQKTGQFTGSVTPPGMRKAVSFKGAILQKQGYGGGHFLGTNQSGRVYFGP